MTAWALVLAATLVLAAWGWRHAPDAEAFFVASRSAGALLAGLAGTAAGLSAFVFVGGPGLFAAVGAASLWIILSAPLTGALQCWAVGEPIVALARSHGCLTVPDLLAARFGEGWPRGLTAAAVVLGGIATLAVQVKGVAVLGGALLGRPGWQVAVLALLATVVYTAAGGMRVGLLAEAAQGVAMGVIALAIAGFALQRAGGPVAAYHTLAAARPELLTAWGEPGPLAGLGLFTLFALGTCAQPHYLQKFLLLRDARALRWLPAVTTGALLAVLTVWVGVGLGGTAMWARGDIAPARPDDLAAAVLGAAPPLLAALAAAAVAAAVMSTAASLLNIVAAALVRDLPRAIGRTPSSRLIGARAATVLAALAGAALGLSSGRTVALLAVLGWGAFTAALLPALVIGLNWSGASRRGAIAALGLGPIVHVALEVVRAGGGAPLWEPGLTGAAAGAIVLVAVSVAERRSTT